MKEHNRLRLERLTQRYAERSGAALPPSEAEFLRAFTEVRDRVLRPAMEEIAAELRRAGHAPEVVLDEGPEKPSIELALGLQGVSGLRNRVGISVVRWEGHPLQLLAYLEASPPRFDLERFAKAEELGEDRVEQLLVDAVEHILACNAP
ncbi:hypothetical protein [Chondromyces crocatus]|uniref:Uncharacterized protein n=1 Tax=Chondromyces crocatus TaxID=52 RepID=A0A0K1EK88_CHOCO|nr:hypothetical protein [Chondromyces crocatus]AKT41279.1 uncharacterized protein CMC5_054460 [Chondromyces crocatus]